MRKTILLAVLVFVLSCFRLAAQKADSALAALADKYPVEKIFIHYDKEYYIAGETIWFKTYLTANGLPSGLSSNFYLRLIDEKGTVRVNQHYPVMGATVRGNIDIPDTLPQGNYYVQAATAASSLYGREFSYEKNIYIINPLHKKQITAGAKKISLQFFPESGALIDGIQTMVAFKAIDENGNPIVCKGVVRTEDGTTISSFSSYHDGMGKLQFKPQAGKKYKAEVEVNGGTQEFSLPAVEASGVNLKIQDEKGGKMFLLTRGAKDKNLFDRVTILADINNKVVYETEVEFEDYPSVKGHLITDSLLSGILHFTVFSKEGLPLAERVTFVNNKEYISAAELVPAKTGFEKRAENNLDISFPETIQRSMSVAITDASTDNYTSKESSWSSFLLTSDLKGYVHNPSWYFENKTDSAAIAMDNLMLTQGWTRYEWKKILTGQFPATTTGENYFLSISGLVKDAGTNQTISGGKLSMYIESGDSSTFNYDIPVGAGGRFALDSIAYYGNSKFFYAYTTSQGKTKQVKVYADSNLVLLPVAFRQDREPMVRSLMSSMESAKEQYQWMYDSKNKVKELERVTVRTRTEKKPIDVVNEKYTTGVFRSMGKVNLDNINQPANERSLNGLDYVKNRIPQVELQGNRFVSRKNFSLNSGQKWAVGVFIDEIPADASLLRTMRVDEIALVKYYDAGFVGVGSGSPGGAIAVYTKRKDTKEETDKLEFFTANGYTVARKFYSPEYSNTNQPELTDRRTTLYWNPDLYSDGETKSVQVKFFNNDFAKKYRVVVEGFDMNGKLIHLEKIITQ